MRSKTNHEKGDTGDEDPSLGREFGWGKRGAQPCVILPTPLPSCPPFTSPRVPLPAAAAPGPSPPRLVLEKPCLPGDGDKDRAPQSASGSPCPGVTAAPCPSAGVQRGSSINEAFNDDYRLVLQASESHLNSGNFKLFWQYKRA